MPRCYRKDEHIYDLYLYRGNANISMVGVSLKLTLMLSGRRHVDVDAINGKLWLPLCVVDIRIPWKSMAPFDGHTSWANLFMANVTDYAKPKNYIKTWVYCQWFIKVEWLNFSLNPKLSLKTNAATVMLHCHKYCLNIVQFRKSCNDDYRAVQHFYFTFCSFSLIVQSYRQLYLTIMGITYLRT